MIAIQRLFGAKPSWNSSKVFEAILCHWARAPGDLLNVPGGWLFVCLKAASSARGAHGGTPAACADPKATKNGHLTHHPPPLETHRGSHLTPVLSVR